MTPLSPRGRYQKGVRLERKTMKHFESLGYATYRMAGSHSPFDVIAMNPNDLVLAQVKGGTAAMTPLEREKALMAPAPSIARKIEVLWPDRARTPIVREIR